MSDTTHLSLPLLSADQAQKHVAHNEALILLDHAIHLAVISRVLAAPPGTPAEGVSGFAALNGGHISIHTDPLTGIAALDIFVRGDIKSGRTVEMLEKAFSASRVVVPRAGLEPTVDGYYLGLAQIAPADFREPVPCDNRVVLGLHAFIRRDDGERRDALA